MTGQDRGKNVAITGAVMQFIFAGVLLVIWLWTDSLTALSSMVFWAAGIPLWLMLILQFYIRQLEQREIGELERLASEGATHGTIFETENDSDLRPAAARAAFFDRWIIPIFTIAWAGILITLGMVVFRVLRGYRIGHSLASGSLAPATMISLVIGFGAFLFSRYATGMGKSASWRPLRSAGSYLLMNVLSVLALIGGLIAAIQESVVADYYIAFIFPAIMLLLSAELLLNFILDLYRPRVPGQEHHPSYDSRLFDLVAEPGRVGHSIAETLNYQFGFEVSKTWFYQLLSRAFVPLLLFGVAVMIGMTSVVIVREGEQGVVLHWGKIGRVMDPGINFKWPWPIDRVTIFEVGKIHEILLGAGEELAPKEESRNVRRRDIMLWTEEHGNRRELDFLIAVPPEARESLKFEGEEPPPPVSIIKLVVAMQYRIIDVEKFGYRVKDAQKLLEDTAYREMVQYCATATLDSPLPGSTSEERPEAIMTYGRARAARELKKRIQAIADKLDLGVEIVFLGLVSAHPPAAAAGAFEAVLEAERRIDEKRYQAEGIANQILVEVAGDPDLGLELAAAIRTLEQLRDMDQMKKSPAGLDLAVRNAIRSTKDSIAQLDIQIAQQKLLGQNLLGRQTAKDRLRESYAAYLERLHAIDADRAGYDYNSAIAEYVKKVDTFFSQVAGRPAVLIAQAQADRWQKELTERGRYESFQRELQAYQASPQVYSFDRWMDVWDEVLPNTMKYVLGVDRDRVEYWLNWELQKEAMEGAFENLDKK